MDGFNTVEVTLNTCKLLL